MGGPAGCAPRGGALPEGDGRINFGLIRAAFLQRSVDPRAWETMSLYELETMWRHMTPKTAEPTDQEWDAAQDMWTEALAGLPDVRL
jgi:hypothetical protein